MRLEQKVFQKFTLRHQTLAIAESCTGGLISDLLTNVAGSSKFFLLGITAYANTAKTKILKVSPALLKKHGAVSAPVAAAMARGRKGACGLVSALMPGKVLKLLVQEGETVEEGQPILILEAMKMQNEYTAPMAGTVARIHVEEGVNLEINAPMITLAPLENEPKG